MNANTLTSFIENSYENPKLGLALHWQSSFVQAGQLLELESDMGKALAFMKKLEGGAIANPDEGRMVGHYWLRSPQLAPRPELQAEIENCLKAIEAFTESVHSGSLRTPRGQTFESVLLIGIGGSALGPQFIHDAFRSKGSRLSMFFFDNTDPDGMQRELESIPDISRCLILVISKSGGTKETRNGMLLAKAYLESQGIHFEQAAVAITGEGSELDTLAKKDSWLARFPMWDWVGGRMSEMSAVGLLPAALEGVSIRELLAGAAAMDECTRHPEYRQNPAALLAMLWYVIGEGKGKKDMVILPYKDRLLLLSRYLQQLIMESLGKEKDLRGEFVHQGISVFGNKGSTDQHAYVQQLRDGVPNFFVTFVEVLSDDAGDIPSLLSSKEVEPGIRAGDYLQGFSLGTEKALAENGRPSITVSLEKLSERSLGALLALFERAVGLYAQLVGINAYHQPGVEAGKKAAGEVIALQHEIQAYVQSQGGTYSLREVLGALPEAVNPIWVHKILRRMASNGKLQLTRGVQILEDAYTKGSAGLQAR